MKTAYEAALEVATARLADELAVAYEDVASSSDLSICLAAVLAEWPTAEAAREQARRALAAYWQPRAEWLEPVILPELWDQQHGGG